MVAKDNIASIERFNEPRRTAVVAVDTAAGIKKRAYVNVDYHTVPPPQAGGDTLTAEVTAGGRVEFVVQFDDLPSTREMRVGGVGGTVAVDSGPGINPFSLDVAGRTAYGKHDGAVRSAELPG